MMLPVHDGTGPQRRASIQWSAAMIVECPHCGANYPVDEKEFAGASKLKGQCKQCHSSFVINAPAELPQLPAEQTVALAVIEGPARGQVCRLSKARTLLGRSGAYVALCDPAVSPNHYAIEVHGSIATFDDLGTKN